MSVLSQDPSPVLESEMRLDEILTRIDAATNLSDALEKIKLEISSLLDVERVSVFLRDKFSGGLVTWFNEGDKQQEVRLSTSTTSMAGFCALTREVINIEDVYDARSLTEIHPKLAWQGVFDLAYQFRTKSVLVAPILFNGALLGALQLINRRQGGLFSAPELVMVDQLARSFGERLSQVLQSTSGPYVDLLEAGRLTQGDLDKVLTRSVVEKQAVSLLLMREMGIGAMEIGESLERFYQIPYMPYDPALVIPESLIQNINASYLRTCGWLPVGGDRHEVTILIDDPSDSHKLREIMRLMNAQIYHFKVGLPVDMLRYLGQKIEDFPHDDTSGERFDAVGAKALVGGLENGPDSAAAELVDRMLRAAQMDRASTIYIEPAGGMLPTTVRFRVDGSVRRKEEFPSELHSAVISLIKDLANRNVVAQHHPHDGEIAMRHDGTTLEFGVVTVQTVHGESMVLRMRSPRIELMKLDELNLAPHNHGMLQKVLAQPHGLFLVVGPAGSGKTTSLHALLNQLNADDRNIWTVEDPVEITQKGLQQVQADPENGRSFAVALRSVLLCDPDIIMVGEMRDRETANMGIEAALSGYPVFSALHSISAPETLTRLMDLGVDKSSFADALLGVMYQRLVPKLCINCKQSEQLTPDIQDQFRSLYGERFDEDCAPYLGQSRTLFRRGKCSACHGTGNFGRLTIHEIVVTSPSLKRLVSSGAPLEQLSEAACHAGMRTLIQDQVIKAFQGHLDFDDVLGLK